MKSLLLLAVTAVACAEEMMMKGMMMDKNGMMMDKNGMMMMDKKMIMTKNGMFTAMMDGNDKLKFKASLKHKSWIAIAFKKMGNLQQDFMWVRVNGKGENDPEVKDYMSGEMMKPSKEDADNMRNVMRMKFDKNMDPMQTIEWTRKLNTGDKDDAMLGCDMADVKEDMMMNGKWVEADWFSQEGTWDQADYQNMGQWFYQFNMVDGKCMFMISMSGAAKAAASVAAISSAYVMSTL